MGGASLVERGNSMSLKGKAEGKVLRGKINRLEELKGYSAYEVAVLNGFSGTEEEWLASLKGEQGEQGVPGAELPVVSKTAAEYKALETAGQLQSDVLYFITDEVTEEERITQLEKDTKQLKEDVAQLEEDTKDIQEMKSDVTDIKEKLTSPLPLLWENPSPDASFAAQTLDMDLKDYGAVLITFVLSNHSSRHEVDHNVKTTETGIFMVGSTTTYTYTSLWRRYTRLVSVSETQITFSAGQGWADEHDGTAVSCGSNEFAVPLKIYGLRG